MDRQGYTNPDIFRPIRNPNRLFPQPVTFLAATGTLRYTASPVYRRAITSSKIVESGRPWYSLIQLVEPHRTILGFDPDLTILNEVITRQYIGLLPQQLRIFLERRSFFTPNMNKKNSKPSQKFTSHNQKTVLKFQKKFL